MHNNCRAGISVGRNGANAVILSGGYEDDRSENNGAVMWVEPSSVQAHVTDNTLL